MQHVSTWFGRFNEFDITLAIRCINRFQRECDYFCVANVSQLRWDMKADIFTFCITYVAPNYKILFFSTRGNCTYQYILEPIPLSTIWTMASILFRAHSLQCETKCWETNDETHQLCTFSAKQVWESKYHTTFSHTHTQSIYLQLIYTWSSIKLLLAFHMVTKCEGYLFT